MICMMNILFKPFNKLVYLFKIKKKKKMSNYQEVGEFNELIAPRIRDTHANQSETSEIQNQEKAINVPFPEDENSPEILKQLSIENKLLAQKTGVEIAPIEHIDKKKPLHVFDGLEEPIFPNTVEKKTVVQPVQPQKSEAPIKMLIDGAKKENILINFSVNVQLPSKELVTVIKNSFPNETEKIVEYISQLVNDQFKTDEIKKFASNYVDLVDDGTYDFNTESLNS